jgi:hypothetical protein
MSLEAEEAVFGGIMLKPESFWKGHQCVVKAWESLK